MTIELLDAFEDALNRRDLSSVASFFADDCRYSPSAAPHADGVVYQGRDEVVGALAAFLDRYPDGRYEDSRFVVVGDRGFGRWNFVGHDRDGQPIRIQGCDLYEFADDKIKVKDAFRKVTQ